MANTVTTTIVARDQASAVFDKLGKSIRNNTALGVVFGNAMTGAIGQASNAVKGLVGGLNDAADVSLSNVGTAGDLAKLTGQSFSESSEDIANFTNRMSKLAADLPGNTSDFVSLGVGISDNLVPAFKDLNGAFDEATFDKFRDSLATAGAIRAEFAGISNQDASLAISKLLGGASVSELRQLKFFEANPAVMAFIEKGLEDTGRDIKDLSKRELVELADTALGVSDEVIEASRSSLKGIMAGFRSTLLDPNTGVFGFLRDLDEDTEGNQSVFASISRVAKKIFSPEGLLGQGAAILENLGLDVDPMRLLADGLGKVGAWLDRTNSWLENIVSMSDDSRGFNAGSFIADLGTKFTEWLTDKVNGMWSDIGELPSNQIGSRIGKGLAVVIDAAMAYIKNLDFGAIAKGVLNIGWIAVVAAGTALANLDWSNVGVVLFKGMMIATAAAVVVLGASIAGLTAPIGAAIAGLGVAAVGVFIGLKNWWTNQGNSIKSAALGFIDSIRNLFSEIRERITSVFKGSDGPSGFTGRRTANKATGLDQMGLFSAIARERSAMPSGANPVIANDSELILPRSGQQGLLNALSSKSGNSLSIGNITINAGSTTDPNALAKQVMKALNREWQSFNQQQLSAAY